MDEDTTKEVVDEVRETTFEERKTLKIQVNSNQDDESRSQRQHGDSDGSKHHMKPCRSFGHRNFSGTVVAWPRRVNR